MAAADYRLLTEATGQRIAAALEALSGTGAAAAAARTNLDVYSKGETDTAIQQSTAKTVEELNEAAISSRGTITGLFAYTEQEVVLNIIFTSSVTMTSSPRVFTLNYYKPKHDCALACIDITSGIVSAINGSVPCGIGENGSVYIKECTSEHIYAITGTYIRA